MTDTRSLARLLLAGTLLLLLGGCAIFKEFAPRVEAEPRGPGEYIAMKRSDILTAALEGYALVKLFGKSEGLETLRQAMALRRPPRRKASDITP